MKLTRRQGSALITVMLLVAVMAVMTTHLLSYGIAERRLNERQRLVLRSRNMSENVVLYASEQITNKLYKLRSPSPRAFLGANALTPTPDDVLTTEFSTPDDVEVRAGLTSTSGLVYLDPNDAANATNPNAGLQVSNSTVPVIGKSTMRHAAVGEATTYAEQKLEVAMMPLFQFAIFYNMDLEFGPGPNMTISGPVHTNGDFISRIQTGFGNTIRFTDRVTSAKGFYANTAHRGPTYMADGDVDNGPGGTGPLYFRKPSESISGGTSIKSSGGVWRDHKWGGTSETASSLSQFRNFATSTYAGNLRTSVHGVTKLVLPAIGDYDETTAEGRRNGRQIIDPPLTTDAGGLRGTKFGRNAGLYLVVNPDDETRTGRLPDGSTVSMRARSYRAYLNTVSGNSHTIREILLPGQPSYGVLNAYVNNQPNAYRVDTSVGPNQILRIPQGGGVDPADTGYAGSTTPPDFDSSPTPAEVLPHDAYFYDMRRAFNNTGYPFNRSSGNRYRPRPIAKIDFDFARFKMAVERTLFVSTTASIYHPGVPNNTNWSSNVLNSSATPASYGLGIATGTNTSFDEFPDTTPVVAIQRNLAGSFLPGIVTLSATQQVGANPTASYAGRFRIETTTDTPSTLGVYATWTEASFSASDVSSLTYTPAGATLTAVRISLYTAGTAAHDSARLLSQRIIPIVDTSGTAVTAALTNDRHVIPCSSTTSGFTYANAVTEMRVFVGGVDDTANWTFSTSLVSASGSVSGSLSTTAPFFNRYAVTAVSNTGTVCTAASPGIVRITAAKTGYTSISRDFQVVKQKSITNAPSDNQTGTWFATTQAVAVDPFRLYFAPENPTDTPVAVQASDLVGSGPSPWFDGITIYVHSVDAEDDSVTGTGNSMLRNRVDSGVRLWNGRGPLVSLPSASYPGRTGLSFVTNDAVYIMGHFNADGTVNSTLSSAGTGGYSGQYPESASEMLSSVMGDAISIFSQPEFSRSGSSPNYRYYPNSGWADSMSASRRDDSANYSTSWMSTNPSGSNTLDGLNASIQPALMPNLTVASSVTGTGPRPRPADTTPSTRTSKFAPSETEVSACLLTGIVPTTRASSSASKQTSGGVHNFPRLSENWAGSVALYIRGSLVAMFESRVATEPWGIRYYQGALRNWGLHQSLRDANHDVPLEPIVLNARRMSYREISAAEYKTLKETIEALPH